LKKTNKAGKIILLSYCTIYAFIGLLSLKELVAIDKFVAAFFCLIFYLVGRKYHIKNTTAFLAGLIFLPHIIGLYGWYSNAILNYHYDWFVHISTAFCATFTTADFILENYSKKTIRAASIAFCIIITFGALIEATEYWGFRSVGLGEGYLGFGAGDDSPNYGPWENSSIDTTLNFLGGFLAFLIFTIFRKRNI
jgi:uncharacterized membrane protein YjdF